MEESNIFKQLIETAEKTPEFHAQGICIEVAEVLFKYRQKHKLSKAEMARKLGISRAGYQKYEKADFNFSVKTLVKIAMAIGSKLEVNFK